MGVELTSAPGSLVAATKRLLATGFTPAPQIPSTPFRPMGSKFNTVNVRQKEWTTAAIDGRWSFDDLIYLFSSLFVLPTPSTPTGATLTRRWTFRPNNFGPDTFQTFTVEMGSGAFGTQFGYAAVNSLTMRATDVETAVTGELLGQGTVEPFTMTAAGLADVTPRVVGPMNIDVLVGPAVGSLVQLNRPQELQIAFANRYGRVVTLDSRTQTHSALVELAPTATAQLVLEHDATSQAYLANLRAVDERFCRVVATGPVIESGFPYRFQITFPFNFTNPAFADRGGVWDATWNLEMIYDGGFGTAVEIVIDSQMTAL